MVLEIGREAMFITLKLAGPLMLVGLLVGVSVALVQALTTIQEITLTFVPKIIVMFFALVVLLPFMIASMIAFSQQMFDRIVMVG
jgi:flagellar biosynthetic protein FliQ